MSVDITRKRSLETVNNELLSIIPERKDEMEGQGRKRRKHEYTLMTQYDNNETQSFDAIEDGISAHVPSGYIKKVTLRNFMCHEYFELELGPRLNFIVGNNGSGKSAILTAITIGLGAKASDTNRGSSLKDLIKEGANSARITLYLENGRFGSYKHDLFGDTIIIERYLKREGSASLSLKTADGTKVSTKKKDVQSLMDYFSIPITNPMCFLSQDAARSFLTAKTPHEKYTHFVKGTLLLDVMENLDKAKALCSSARSSMSLHRENLKVLKQEYDNAKKLVEQMNQTSVLTERKLLLQGKSLWIDVQQNSNSCNKLRDNIRAYETRISEIDQKIKARRDRMDRYETDNSSSEKDIEEKMLQASNLDKKHQEARIALREIRDKFDEEKRNKEDAELNVRASQKKIESLNRTIRTLEEELKKEMGGDRDQIQIELKESEEAVEGFNDLKKSLVLELKDLQNEEIQIANERQREIRAIEQSVQGKLSELRRIREGTNNFLSNFDPNMDHLLAEIEKRKAEFKVPPIGPLGNYITVKESHKKWVMPIQTFLYSSLGAFIVSKNFSDKDLLRRIIKSCNVRTSIPIISYDLKKFDFSRGMAQTQFSTVYDALEFKIPELAHLLVNTNKIEKTLLIENRDYARQFLRQKPKNVIGALSFRDQYGGYQLFGGYQLDSVRYPTKMKIKVGNSSDNGISFLTDSINQERMELDLVREKYHERLSQKRTQIKKVDSEVQRISGEIRNMNHKITKLRVNIGKVVDTGILSSKISERDSLKSVLTSYQAAVEAQEAKINEITEAAKPIREEVGETRKALEQVEKQLEELKQNVAMRRAKIEKYTFDIQNYEAKKNEYSGNIKSIEENIKTLEEGIERQVSRACEFCPKEKLLDKDLPDNQEDIRRELERISHLIKQVERQVGLSQERVIELFQKCRTAYKEGQNKYVAVNGALEQLEESIKRRLHNFELARRQTFLDADIDFRASLRLRSLTGKLVFLNESKNLNIFIRTPNDKVERNVDTLSGGEKSFSQMALLLATWKPMRSRIIALDEFDVFMDQVNRKIGTGLLVKKLKDNARTQTIIITPQDIGKITSIDSNGVVIHRMKDPERHNNSTFYNASVI